MDNATHADLCSGKEHAAYPGWNPMMYGWPIPTPPMPHPMMYGWPTPPMPHPMMNGWPTPPMPHPMMNGWPSPPKPHPMMNGWPTPPMPHHMMNGWPIPPPHQPHPLYHAGPPPNRCMQQPELPNDSAVPQEFRTISQDNDECLDDWAHRITIIAEILRQRGYAARNEKEQTFEQVRVEIARRKRLGSEFIKRMDIIRSSYEYLHQHLLKFQESYLSSEFLRIVEYCRRVDVTAAGVTAYMLQSTHTCKGSGIYTFPVFARRFCEQLLQEIERFEASDCPKGRPNSINRYGVLLDELGFDDFISTFREQYLCPIARLLFPADVGPGLDSHKAFVVKYNLAEDVQLDCHFNNAEVTLSVALSTPDSFSGGNLYFNVSRVGINTDYSSSSAPGDTDENTPRVLADTDMDDPGSMNTVSFLDYEHAHTVGVLHRGNVMHGARHITAGSRYDLIMWMRSSTIRNQRCPMCGNKPDLVETVGFGDGFTKHVPDQRTVDICSIH